MTRTAAVAAGLTLLFAQICCAQPPLQPPRSHAAVSSAEPTQCPIRAKSCPPPTATCGLESGRIVATFSVRTPAATLVAIGAVLPPAGLSPAGPLLAVETPWAEPPKRLQLRI